MVVEHTVRQYLRRTLNMEILQQKNLSSVRTPLGGDKVYKDECVYSFDTPVRIVLR